MPHTNSSSSMDMPMRMYCLSSNCFHVSTTDVLDLMICNLSNSGMLVVCSIHQPRFQAYEMFDTLLLLRKGQLAYGGAVRAAAEVINS